MEMVFHSHANKTHLHKKGCALGLILKGRVFGTQKWPIQPLSASEESWQYFFLFLFFSLTLQRGDQLVCPPGESLENMLILQDTLNDERSHRSDSQVSSPSPQGNKSSGCSPPNMGCAQPSIIPNPTASSSVGKRTSLIIDAVSQNVFHKGVSPLNLVSLSIRAKIPFSAMREEWKQGYPFLPLTKASVKSYKVQNIFL